MPKKRPIPKPKTVIRSSAKPLTLRYAELLHLRRAVQEAEIAGRPNRSQCDTRKDAASHRLVRNQFGFSSEFRCRSIYSAAGLAHALRGLFLSGSKFLITNSSIE